MEVGSHWGEPGGKTWGGHSESSLGGEVSCSAWLLQGMEGCSAAGAALGPGPVLPVEKRGKVERSFSSVLKKK